MNSQAEDDSSSSPLQHAETPLYTPPAPPSSMPYPPQHHQQPVYPYGYQPYPPPFPPHAAAYHPSMMHVQPSYPYASTNSNNSGSGMMMSAPVVGQHSLRRAGSPDHTDASSSGTTAAKASLLLTAGGILGLTAAAAVRWLNGGDFYLLPPPSRQQPGVTVDQQQEQPEHDESTSVSKHAALVEQVQTAVQQLQDSCTRQERMLQRVTTDYEQRRTNESMDRLRTNMEATDASCAATTTKQEQTCLILSEILSELSWLRKELGGGRVGDEKDEQRSCVSSKDWDSQLSSTMERLQGCLEQLSSKDDPPKAPDLGATATHSVETSFSTAVDDSVSDEDEEKSVTLLPPTLEDALNRLLQENEPNQLQVGARLLSLYVVNLQSHPRVPRYRKIFTSNESFQKVDQLNGGRDLLLALGFVDTGNCLEWQVPQGQEETMYFERLKVATSALERLKVAPPAPRTTAENGGASLSATNHTTDNALKAKELKSAPIINIPIQESLSTDETATPPLSPAPPESHATLSCDRLPALQTPEIGSILSPPVTKKQIFGSLSEFPPMGSLVQPTLTAITVDVDNVVQDLEPDSSGPDGAQDGGEQ